MALPGDGPAPPSIYGIRLRVTPDTSGDNPDGAYTVLFNSTSAGGTYKGIAWSQGVTVWTFDHTLPADAPRQYYKVWTSFPNMTASSYIGPVDALVTNLGVET